MTVTLALVFLTLEIDKQLAPHGPWSVPIIYQVIVGSYIILAPNLVFTIWANAKDRTKTPGKFAHGVLHIKAKLTKIVHDEVQDSIQFNDSEEISKKQWNSYELILQNLIFAFQTVCLLATHSK